MHPALVTQIVTFWLAWISVLLIKGLNQHGALNPASTFRDHALEDGGKNRYRSAAAQHESPAMSEIVQRKPREARAANRSSDRQFGLVMAGFFAILAALAGWRGGWSWLGSWLALAAIFFTTALTMPAILMPLNYLWFRLGLLLHRLMTPVIMALIFFALITPIAIVMRIFGKRPIPLRFDRQAKSYWVTRDPGGPGPMSKQY